MARFLGWQPKKWAVPTSLWELIQFPQFGATAEAAADHTMTSKTFEITACVIIQPVVTESCSTKIKMTQ